MNHKLVNWITVTGPNFVAILIDLKVLHGSTVTGIDLMPGLNRSADIIEMIAAAPTFFGSFLADWQKAMKR